MQTYTRLAIAAYAAQTERERFEAAAYRWLREQDWWNAELCVLREPNRVLTRGIGLGADCPSRERLDTAIAAAMGWPTVPPKE